MEYLEFVARNLEAVGEVAKVLGDEEMVNGPRGCLGVL